MEQIPTHPLPSMEEIEARLLALGGEVQPSIADTLDEFPVINNFTPGLYSRTIFMPAGSVVVSRIHKTEHQFVVSQGDCLVYSPNTGPVRIRAPHMGITKPGTHRVLVMLADTIWTTFHATDLTDLKELDEALLEPVSAHPALADAAKREIAQ